MPLPPVRYNWPMGFLKNLFGAKSVPLPPRGDGMDQQLVRLHIPVRGEMGDEEEFDRWVALEDVLDEAARTEGVGELDGNEVGGGEFTIWLYGPNASALAEVIKATALGSQPPTRLQALAASR
jgi:hypothetical protein